jgi:DNA polymerase I-like protein with 3'-5' exonuclease and polymerase domains
MPRAKTVYKITGTESGRTSTSVVKPPDSITQYGVAFQTIAKHDDVTLDVGISGLDIRSMFIADKNFVFLEWDYAQAEDRVVQVLAKDWDALKDMERTNYKKNIHGCKDDRHTLTAVMCCDKPFEDITDYDRQIGKKTRHAGNYNMGKHQGMLNFAKYGVFLSEWKVGQLLSKFHAANSKIKQVFHQEIQEALRDNQCTLYSPDGRKRIFFNRWGDDMFKEAYSYIPQATVSDSMKFSMCRIIKQLPKDNFYIVHEGHDSGLALVRRGNEKDFAKIIKYEGEKPINFSRCTLSRNYDLSIPVDFKIGVVWSELENFKV